MDQLYFIGVMLVGLVIIIFYGYRSLWARYRASKKPQMPCGEPAPPLKRTISGETPAIDPGSEMNEKMLEWQKMYQLASDSGLDFVGELSESKRIKSNKAKPYADIPMPGESKLSYQQFIQRKLAIMRAMEEPDDTKQQAPEVTLTSHAGRFY